MRYNCLDWSCLFGGGCFKTWNPEILPFVGFGLCSPLNLPFEVFLILRQSLTSFWWFNDRWLIAGLPLSWTWNCCRPLKSTGPVEMNLKFQSYVGIRWGLYRLYSVLDSPIVLHWLPNCMGCPAEWCDHMGEEADPTAGKCGRWLQCLDRFGVFHCPSLTLISHVCVRNDQLNMSSSQQVLRFRLLMHFPANTS
jgi:hypothetical protein